MLELNDKEHRVLKQFCQHEECSIEPADDIVRSLVNQGFAEVVIRVTMAGFRAAAHYIPRREANDNDN